MSAARQSTAPAAPSAAARGLPDLHRVLGEADHLEALLHELQRRFDGSRRALWIASVRARPPSRSPGAGGRPRPRPHRPRRPGAPARGVVAGSRRRRRRRPPAASRGRRTRPSCSGAAIMPTSEAPTAAPSAAPAPPPGSGRPLPRASRQSATERAREVRDRHRKSPRIAVPCFPREGGARARATRPSVVYEAGGERRGQRASRPSQVEVEIANTEAPPPPPRRSGCPRAGAPRRGERPASPARGEACRDAASRGRRARRRRRRRARSQPRRPQHVRWPGSAACS